MEFVDLLKNPNKYKELGAKPPKGAILLGRYPHLIPFISIKFFQILNVIKSYSVLSISLQFC